MLEVDSETEVKANCHNLEIYNYSSVFSSSIINAGPDEMGSAIIDGVWGSRELAIPGARRGCHWLATPRSTSST